MKDTPSADSKGNNLIGIAYAKAAEMADTLENSGTAKRTPMTGIWLAGRCELVAWKTGYVIVAFQRRGKSEDDALKSPEPDSTWFERALRAFKPPPQPAASSSQTLYRFLCLSGEESWRSGV